MEDTFLKTGDVANFFGVTLRTIKNWRQLGKLIHVKLNEHGHFLYSSSQVEEYKKILAAQNANKAKDKFSTISAQKPQKICQKLNLKKPLLKLQLLKLQLLRLTNKKTNPMETFFKANLPMLLLLLLVKTLSLTLLITLLSQRQRSNCNRTIFTS